MYAEQKSSNAPRKLHSAPTQRQQKCTREIEAAAPTAMRPAPAGQDSGESDRPKETRISKCDPSTWSLTPRRFTNKEALLMRHSSEEEKLAPLGFEPEGSAAATPPCEWPSNFEDLLADSRGFELFSEYLRQENCEILLEFWQACQSFRQMAPTSYHMRASAKAIFQRFVHSRVENALAVRDSTRSKIAQHVNDQPIAADLFEEALSEVTDNMKNNHYSNFLNSNLWKEYGQMDVSGGSPKEFYDQPPYDDRFRGGYLPTLPEEKVLGFDEIEEEQFEYDQVGKSVNGLSCNARRTNPDENNARSLLHKPAKDMLSQCYYNPAPAASRMDSENQSLSSDALTDDTLSIGRDSTYTDSDCMSRSSSGQKRRCGRSCSGLPRVPGFVPRTKRLPKEVKHPRSPDEFARILTAKLEKVLLERELQEREASNLSASLEAEMSNPYKKSILQEAIENKEKHDRIPLSTMAMTAGAFDDAASLSVSSSHQDSSSAKSGTANATSGSSTVHNSSSSESTHRRSRRQHDTKPKATETAEKTSESHHSGGSSHPKENVWESHPRRDDDIPFLPVNHSRIMKWIEEGTRCVAEESVRHSRHHRQQNPSPSSARSSSRNKQSNSSSRPEKYISSHRPNQPIAQDPMMPPLPQPEASTVLEEAKRRLIERHENERRSRPHKQRSRSSVDDVGDSVSCYREKQSGSSCCCSATDCSSSSCAHSMLSYDLHRAAPSCAPSSTISSSVPSSASNAHSDPRSKDSGIGAPARRKEKHNVTVVTYWLWGEPIPYRTSLPGKYVTLGQFKMLISRVGQFRYFFKRETGDRDCEVVYEEVKDETATLPTYDGKVVGKVEKVDS